MSNSASKDDIRSTILAMLPPGRARSELSDGGIDDSTRLLDVGLVDSAGLLDIILEIESRYGVEFNPEHIDSETSITLGGLISAFDPVSR